MLPPPPSQIRQLWPMPRPSTMALPAVKIAKVIVAQARAVAAAPQVAAVAVARAIQVQRHHQIEAVHNCLPAVAQVPCRPMMVCAAVLAMMTHSY